MPQTPYAPPTARVSDPPEPSKRPLSVQRAATCLWASAGVTALLTILQGVGIVVTPNVGITVVTGCLTVALLGWIAEQIRAGRVWARWLFLVIYVLGLVAILSVAVFAPQLFLSQTPVLQTSSVVQLAVQTIALVLMFNPESRQWFGRPHASTRNAL